VEASAKVWKYLVVELATAKQALNFKGRVFDNGRSQVFRDVL
jgi:hypothetical protein